MNTIESSLPKILIVDDKINNLVALETILADTSAQCMRATSGDEALRLLLHNAFALAILDIQMPEMDGYELAQLIRNRERTSHLPIIFVSAVFSDHSHIFKGYESGGVDFLTKPFDPKILVNKVQVFLELYEQKKKLAHVADLYEKTFNAITDVVAIKDASMRIRQVNQQGCDLLNLSEEEIIGHYCYTLFHGSDTPCPGCKLAETPMHIPPSPWEIRHDKLGMDFLMSASHLDYSERGEVLTVYVARDITEQKKVEKQLVQTEKLEAIGTLAGGIAHDFNNILSAVLGFTELSLFEEDLPPDIIENLENIKKAGLRAKDLVAQILTFSRKNDVKRSPIYITPIVKEALKLIRSTIPKTIEIKSNIQVQQEKIIADPIEIHQIIVNMCTNSFHAIENEQGAISIELLPVQLDVNTAKEKHGLSPGEYLCLTISDTGVGIEKNIQKNIFEPFFTTKEQGQGTGMGLSVVHGIISNCKGTISVKSDVGIGTTFEIFFPLAPSQAEVATAVDTTNLQSGTGHILFIDDEPELVKVGRKYLEYLGYSVTTALSGTDALRIFRDDSNQFAAVITDQTMPGLPGNLLAQELLAIRPDIPVILCSGHSTVVSKQKAREAGIKAYLTKPVSIHNYSETLHNIIQSETT